MFDLNPLDVLNRRKLEFLPVHFAKVKISDSNMWDNKVEQWVRTKLKGRYCIVRSPMIDSSGKLKSVYILGLEDQKEMTYFMLAYQFDRR